MMMQFIGPFRLRSHGINKNDDLFQNIEDAYTDGEPNLWYYEMSSLGFSLPVDGYPHHWPIHN